MENSLLLLSSYDIHRIRILSIFLRVNLPNGHLARVAEIKILAYLLSSTHPDGRAKHDFFVRFGFRPHDPDQLAEALLHHGQSFEVVRMEHTLFGRRYVIEGPLDSPDGRNPVIRAVWFIDSGDDVPRLITAYPRPKGD